MKIQLKFKSQKAYKACYNYIEGHGFFFRNHNKDRLLEFCYEYTMRDVAEICDKELDLKDKYEMILS
jgi:hypothetical protein